MQAGPTLGHSLRALPRHPHPHPHPHRVCMTAPDYQTFVMHLVRLSSRYERTHVKCWVPVYTMSWCQTRPMIPPPKMTPMIATHLRILACRYKCKRITDIPVNTLFTVFLHQKQAGADRQADGRQTGDRTQCVWRIRASWKYRFCNDVWQRGKWTYVESTVIKRQYNRTFLTACM